ncbi:hypothetical protein VKS41_007988 [Umbelopsis sp. WA50703]
MPLFKKSSSSEKKISGTSKISSNPSSSQKKTKSPKDPNEKLPPILSTTWGPVVPKAAKGR